MIYHNYTLFQFINSFTFDYILFKTQKPVKEVQQFDIKGAIFPFLAYV